MTAPVEALAEEACDEGGRGPKQADILIELAQEAHLFHAPDMTGFLDLQVKDHRETWPIRSKGFRRWLARRFFDETGGAPNSEALQAALNVIEAKTHFDGPERKVHIRIDSMGERLYLNLGDEAWRAAEIGADDCRVIDHPPVNPNRRPKRDFAFTGLIRCGHCGCSMVAEIKKSRYVYYHCSRAKGKCPEPHTREKVLEERFAELLDQLRFDDEVLAGVSQALRVSHDDEKQHHEEAIRRIQAGYNRFQNRIDAMYIDKLDGRIDTDFFDRKASEWRAEQQRCLEEIRRHQHANQTYMDEGIRLLELAQKAGSLFRQQSAAEKRRLLGFVLSNCTWKDG